MKVVIPSVITIDEDYALEGVCEYLYNFVTDELCGFEEQEDYENIHEAILKDLEKAIAKKILETC